MDDILKAKIEQTNMLARQFKKQNYVDMIVNIYKTDPPEARRQCRWWMELYPPLLSDLGELVKLELNKTK